MERNLTKKCIRCGKIFQAALDRALFCSDRCCQAYHYRKKREGKNNRIIPAVGEICPWNDFVVCKNRNCSRCGWNPTISLQRLRDESVEVADENIIP